MFAKVHKSLNFYSLFLFSLLLIKAPNSWGFSNLNTLKYLGLAKSSQLWTDPKWIHLGHYKKDLWGNSKSSFRGPFFIHPDGFNSPEKELLASIETLFSQSIELTQKFGRHPQCQFLARRKWLIQKLNINSEDILPCEERTQWKKQLGATAVTLIFASSDLGNPASSFGHTFLKLINPSNSKNKDLIDYGVNYAADADQSEGFFYALKGLFGFYDGRFTMLPYHQKIREYINLEGRDIWEYPLALSSTEVEELIDHLLELDGSVSPYYFFSDNCSYQILVALDAIRPDFKISDDFSAWVIPIDTVKVVSRKTNLIEIKKYKQSLKSNYLESYSKLNEEQKKALNTSIENYSIPNNILLSNIQKAEVYETTLKYLSVKAYRTNTDLDDAKYQISIQRASLGTITNEIDSIKTISPDQSHDSSAFYLGYGRNTQSDYSSFKFRAAFHDLEQNDQGVVPFSQNNFGALELRYYSEIKKAKIERFTFLNLISTNPVNSLDTNFSWKVRFDVLDQFRPDIEVGGGLSFDTSSYLSILNTSRISYFISGRYLKEQNQINQDTYQVGPELLLNIKPTERIGASLDLAYFADFKRTPAFRFKTKINYQLYTNFDIQLLALREKNQSDEINDFQVSLVKNFIF